MKRHEVRQKALQALFEIDLGRGDANDAMAHVMEEVAAVQPQDVKYLHWLVLGTRENRADLDDVLEAHVEGWKLNRMARVDLNVLRMALYELQYEHDVDVATICNEAVELAKDFSTDESGKFVNGVLARVLPNATAARARNHDRHSDDSSDTVD
ncbi:transcription antitermination factor NusB [Alicyclobacillus sp. SO9]|uniref:transcription antitermination factor NusB n=1 Tax=Alicyclobacillus sp. SO9 TaxID=2665646 RepID=UPI0018E8DB27|nr:transcription antitermination factor NusB [Alicyclobacillus sp. SO9]QQE76970.1 transcription antitermination factor NusB [Alicyclobacillus sp. SO9]